MSTHQWSVFLYMKHYSFMIIVTGCAGEFMQLGSKEDESERFNHYMMKTFKKTASLLANSCKSVSVYSRGVHGVY